MWSVEKILEGAAIVGVTKCIKNGGTILTKLGRIKSNLGTIAKNAFQRKQSSGTKVDVESAQKVVAAAETNPVVKARMEAANKAPYNSRAVEAVLKERYGETAVSSTTMTDIKGRNVKLSGMVHPETGIVFTEKGMPIFDSVAVCDLKISQKTASIKNSKLHFKEATAELSKLIEAGVISKKYFTEETINAINKPGAIRVPGYIWHHHEDFSRIQLVPEWYHIKTGHEGGMKLWPFLNVGGQ